VLAPAIRLGLERLEAALVIGHVRAVHRAQRYAHRNRNRRLRHPALTQHHYLDALALRGRYLPPQRSFQPPHLGFAAFDHLLPRIRWRKRITPRGEKQPPITCQNLDSSRYGGGMSRRIPSKVEKPIVRDDSGMGLRVFKEIRSWLTMS
jgi:hypothetical protein